jgi:hypothetical protein
MGAIAVFFGKRLVQWGNSLSHRALISRRETGVRHALFQKMAVRFKALLVVAA